MFFVFPETAGKTLEEVQDIFLSGTPAWRTHVGTREVLALERGEIVDPEKFHAEHEEADIAPVAV